MLKLKTILQSRYLFKILVIISLLYSLLVTNLYPFTSKYHKNETIIAGIITKYTIDGNKATFYLKGKETIIAHYYLKNGQEKNYYEKNFHLGDKISIEGQLSIPQNNTIPNIFNYKNYLYYNKIFYLMNGSKITKLNNNTSIFYYLKTRITNRVEKIDKTGYLKTFILGDKLDLDQDSVTNYQINGISHLFSISGMHISLLATIILYALKKVSYNNKINYTIVLSFLIFYLFLTNMGPSILRTTIMFILMAINKCYNLKIKSLDIILLVLVIVIIINPFYIYNIGFQFSYLISFTLILLSKKISNIKSKLLSNLYISLICFTVSFPICIYNFYQVNFLSILWNIFLIPLVSIVIYPLSLLTFIIPILEPIFRLSITILEFINNICSNITIFQIILKKPSIFIIIFYYTIIYLSFYNKKIISILLLIIFLHKSIVYFDNKLSIIILDVSQGDSIFIKLPQNKGNILIDTGGIISYDKEKWEKKKKEYSIANSKIIPYLKSIGVDKINYLILTHGDADHMGETRTLVNNFKINNVLFNKGEYNTLENNLIKCLKQKNIPYTQNLTSLKINHYKFYFLNNEIYQDENSNSNVIYFAYQNYKFLFMGDAPSEVEHKIIEDYNLKNITFLKVGHHGSDTSTSQEFVTTINPKISFISVGKNNRYNHPKEITLKTLKRSKIYRTDIDGSIELKIGKSCKINNYAS